jgi:hypothetical protein
LAISRSTAQCWLVIVWLISPNAVAPAFAQGTLHAHSMMAATVAISNVCGEGLVIAGPSITVGQFPDIAYVHALSKAEIRSLESEATGLTHETVGLTHILTGGVEVRTTEAQTPNGTRCIVVEAVKLFPMKQATIYIPREYPEGSCNYDVLKRHEEEHVAIARRLLKEYAPRFLVAVRDLRLESRGFAAWIDDENSSNERFASEVQPAVQTILDELHSAMKDRNRAFDARDTERALRECPFW